MMGINVNSNANRAAYTAKCSSTPLQQQKPQNSAKASCAGAQGFDFEGPSTNKSYRDLPNETDQSSYEPRSKISPDVAMGALAVGVAAIAFMPMVGPLVLGLVALAFVSGAFGSKTNAAETTPSAPTMPSAPITPNPPVDTNVPFGSTFGAAPNTRPKPGAAGAAPTSGAGPAPEMATFIQSGEGALSFIKDLGLNQDGGYYQKHSEALDKNIKALKESPNDAGLAKKVRNSVARLIHPDKLQQNGHAGATPKAQELMKAVNSSYNGAIAEPGTGPKLGKDGAAHNTGPKPGAAGAAPTSGAGPTPEMATFVQSGEDALSFIKDLGLNHDSGYYQKHFEALETNIKALNESPNDVGRAKKVRNSVARLIHPDKLQQNGHAGATPKAQEIMKAVNSSYNASIAES